MESFLKSVERQAYRMALIASNNRDDALDLVQGPIRTPSTSMSPCSFILSIKKKMGSSNNLTPLNYNKFEQADDSYSSKLAIKTSA